MHISLLWDDNRRLRLAVNPAPSVAALATASIKATIQDDTTQLYIHPLNSLSILFSFLTLQAWPTVKRTFELYPGAAMPYNEHRISGKIASMCRTCITRMHGAGGGKVRWQIAGEKFAPSAAAAAVG